MRPPLPRFYAWTRVPVYPGTRDSSEKNPRVPGLVLPRVPGYPGSEWETDTTPKARNVSSINRQPDPQICLPETLQILELGYPGTRPASTAGVKTK
eukprot:887107-Rhodomonas_salina.1